VSDAKKLESRHASARGGFLFCSSSRVNGNNTSSCAPAWPPKAFGAEGKTRLSIGLHFFIFLDRPSEFLAKRFLEGNKKNK
jgi:hypothetical protein